MSDTPNLPRKIIARLLPLRVKIWLHHAYRSTAYKASVLAGKRDPLLPPEWLHSVGEGGAGDTGSVGQDFLNFFVNLGGLGRHERVLDIGSGTGRMARPLTKYLKNYGSYDGMDIVEPSIKWCQKAYARRHPNFRYHFADIYNSAFNPAGIHQASEYRFPFEDSTFGFVFLTSVFTHMLPPDMENYLREIRRVLKPGGRCLITFFLLNSESRKLIEDGKASLTFDYELPGCRVEQADVPEAAIAYDEGKIRELFETCGFSISEPIHYGSWCGRENGVSYQDMVVASVAG